MFFQMAACDCACRKATSAVELKKQYLTTNTSRKHTVLCHIGRLKVWPRRSASSLVPSGIPEIEYTATQKRERGQGMCRERLNYEHGLPYKLPACRNGLVQEACVH